MRLAFVCLALCGSVKAQSMTGFWTGTFTENSINKTLQVYFDSNGIYESRMEKSDSTGMILSWKDEIGHWLQTTDTVTIQADTSIEADTNLNITYRWGLDTALNFPLSFTGPDTARWGDSTGYILFSRLGGAGAFTFPDLFGSAAILPGKSSPANRSRFRHARLIWNGRAYNVLGRNFRPADILK